VTVPTKLAGGGVRSTRLLRWEDASKAAGTGAGEALAIAAAIVKMKKVGTIMLWRMMMLDIARLVPGECLEIKKNTGYVEYLYSAVSLCSLLLALII
jgi:hypothetical protein